ncbi:RNA polymerase sigma factor [Streptomyces sp. NBC_00510]
MSWCASGTPRCGATCGGWSARRTSRTISRRRRGSPCCGGCRDCGSPNGSPPRLFTIARRAVTDHLRQAYRVSETSVEEAGTVVVDDGDSLSGVLTAMQVEAGLNGLPLPEREVLILFHLQDLPLAACAEVLGVPPGTVKSRLHRARRMLRSVLAERGYEA